MVNTAEKIAEKIKNKTIVLTGAMIPYAFEVLQMDFLIMGVHCLLSKLLKMVFILLLTVNI